MKKTLIVLLMLVMIVSVAIPVTVQADAPVVLNLTVVSDTNVKVVGVYNESSGTHGTLVNTNQNAVLAAEPLAPPAPNGYPNKYGVDATGSLWDNGLILGSTSDYFESINSNAKWIWETTHAEDPAGLSGALKDTDASSNGRVVVFEKTFFIAGTPHDATLLIAADNCYEVHINGFTYTSPTAHGNWVTSNLHETSVNSSGWQAVGQITIPAAKLFANDNNTITILAGNEFYSKPGETPEVNNENQPVFSPDPYSQYNPAGLIFQLDVPYESGPNPPVPELPAGILLGIGLVGVGGFFLVRRHQKATAK